MRINKMLCLVLCAMLLLAAIPCAFGEEESAEGTRRMRLGKSFYSVEIDDDFVLGEMTEEDIADDQIGYYVNDATGLDFDLYQFAKDDLDDQASRYVLEEAMEYDNVIEVRPNEQVNDIDYAMYRTVEEFDGMAYETLNYILDDGDEFIELVFWTENEADVAEVETIIASLQLGGLKEIQLGLSPFSLYVPDDFQEGGLTAEDEDGDLMSYYYSDQTLLDFDVYQFSKEGLPENLPDYVEQEASEYDVINELVKLGDINGEPAGWYRTVEESEDGEYDTLTYILDAGNDYVEVVFWLDGFTAEAEADYIIHNLVDSRLYEEDDNGGAEASEAQPSDN